MTEASIDELRAVFLSRDFVNGEVGACGMAAPVPMAAMRLAQELHAPDLVIASEAGIDPRPSRLVTVPVDPRANEGAEAITDLYDMFVKAEHGIDFWFMSGIQTDRVGNLNLHRIGGPADGPPKFRGPGVGNISYAATSTRWYNYTHRHDPRTFVERVDFVTALGNGPERSNLGYGEGCRFVITSKAVLVFDAGAMTLRHVHPGVTVEEVVASTGFELVVPADITETPTPTAEELAVLRTVIDPTGVLRGG